MLQLDMHQMHHPPRSPPSHIDTSRFDSPHTPPYPGVTAAASRFLVSMRKSFSPPTPSRRKNTENPRAAMYSTPEERHSYHPSRAGPSRYLDARPTIEQIAMGLHVSCTPHLRPAAGPLQRYPLSSPPPRRSLNTPVLSPRASPDNLHDTSTSSSQHRMHHNLPPPPSRSSMKRSSPSIVTLAQPQQPRLLSSGASPSPSITTSGGLVTPDASHSLSSLRARVSRFIPGYRPLSSPSSLGRASSFTSSASDSTRPATPRKAVRFSTSVLAKDEQPS